MAEPQILEQAGPILKERPRARLRGKVVQRALRSVEPNPWNPNVVPEAMMRSIEQGLVEDGWIASKALLVWGEDESGRRRDLIIDGEHMWTAALAVGITRGPMVFLDGIAEAEAKALTVKLDQKRGRWDDAKLAELLRDIDAQARGAEAQLSAHGLGFTQEELDALLTVPSIGVSPSPEGALPAEAELGEEPAVDPTDEILAKWEVLGCVSGSLWEIPSADGQRVHRVLCGDARKREDVARLFDGRKAAVAFTSPPYASQRKYDETSGFRPIPPDEYVEWFEPVQANTRAHLASDGSWFVNIKEHCEGGERSLYVKDLTIAHKRLWGWRFIDELVWKHGGFPGKLTGRFKNGWEPVFHFAGGWPIKFAPERVGHASDGIPVREKGDPGREYAHGNIGVPDRRRGGVALPSNVVEVSGGTEATHCAAFPPALPSFFVRAYSDPLDIIFDPFLGSGTTLIAAEKLGRVGYGTEISARYVAVTLERLTRAGLTPRRVS